MTNPILYHYTSQKGLLGIIENKKLWATSILYMNDSKELIYALELTNDILSQRINTERTEGRVFLKQIQNALSKIPEISTNSIFVCSFSEVSDLLSQWRGYCSNGNGFSIGFEIPDFIPSIFSIQGFFLHKCVYDVAQQRQLLNSFFDEFITRYIERKKGNLNIDLSTFYSMTLMNYVNLAAEIKHPSFQEEKEWRLISLPIIFNDTRIKYRQGRISIIPYVEISLIGEEKEMSLPEIWIWPHNQLTINSLEGLLITNHINGNSKSTHINNNGKEILIPAIKTSSIPYRIY